MATLLNVMKTVLFKKIEAKAEEISDDYFELSADHFCAMSSLKTKESFDKISDLENLLKEKNYVDCTHALCKGYFFEKEDLTIEKLNEYEEIFEKGLDETVNTRELQESADYCELESRIRNTENEIISLFKDNTETIGVLFDTYGNMNFELIRAAFILGCEYRQFGKLIMDTHK